MDALITGAGFAGCIAGLLLQKAGAQFLLVERSKPLDFGLAASHAHRFRPDDLETCGALIDLPASKLASFGRADLLGAMRRKLDARGTIVWEERIAQLIRESEGWSAITRGGRLYGFERAIDASGGAYALAEKAEAAMHAALTVAHLPDNWMYTSWRVQRPCEPGWSASLEGGMAFCTPSQGAMIATLACPEADVTHKDTLAQQAARALGLAEEELDPPAAVYRGSALARTSAEAPVLRIGESLIRTPPRFGDGLHHALTTARMALDAASAGDAASSLDAYADQVWAGNSFAMALEANGPAPVSDAP